MKSLRNRRHLPVWQILTALCLLFPSGKAAAQGEWRWANSWSGNDGFGSKYYNKVISSAFDDDGNIYIFGEFGGNAVLHDQQGWDYICDSTVVVPPSSPAMMLAKFDTLGNLLWRKAFKIPGTDGITPYDMVLKDGVIHLTGRVIRYENGFVQYWDTIFFALNHGLMPEYPYIISNPPYTTGFYTYFANFDLDGNLLEDHFVGALPRIYNSSMGGFIRTCEPLCDLYSRMCVDSQGNTYLIADRKYYGREELPFYVVIDEDSAHTYPVYFPGSSRDGAGIHNMIIYKFTPDWELAWAKPLIDHLELPSGTLPLDSLLRVIYKIEGFSIDQDDNLYVSGYITELMIRGHSAEYPIFIYWDSTRYLESVDTSRFAITAFITKYDSDGNLIWNNQPSIINAPTDNFTESNFTENFVKGDYVYVVGGGNYNRNGGMVYFDSPDNPLIYPNETQSGIGFFVRYNRHTGQFVNYGVLPSEIYSEMKGEISVINNHVIGGGAIKFTNLGNSTGLAVWNEDGQFMGVDTFYSSKGCQTINVLAKEDGTLLCDMLAFCDISFSNGLSTQGCSSGRSNAIFTLYHNENFSVPFPDGIPSHTIPLQSLRLYPNPASTLVRIELPEGFTEYTVSLYDMQGHLAGIYRKDVIDVSALSPGIYTVNVLSAKESLSGKLVIER